MRKKVVAIVLSFLLFCSAAPIQAFATEIGNVKTSEKPTIGEIGGYLEGAIKTITTTNNERNFTWPTGQGFAAETANNLSDRLRGKNATVVGGDNAKNGPDRRILNRDGTTTWIQDKYYKSAVDSLNAAFDKESGVYRYIDGDGKPMKLEVPADEYDDVLSGFSKKIADGKVPSVTNPDDANLYVQKGRYTYQQAKNLTKAGNIDSLKYDATNGVITATCAMGITFVLDYASCIINGQNPAIALKEASINGLKTGSLIFATYVISSQLCKTGLKTALTPTAEAIARSFGDDISKAILATCGKDAATMTAKQITSEVANILSNQIIVEGVIIIALTVPDVIDLCKGRISTEQLLKNLTVVILSAAGTVGGTIGGATLGGAIASAPGAVIGGIIGGIAGGTGTGFISEWALSQFLKDDADKMYEIITEEFQNLCEAYLVTQPEADAIIEQLQGILSSDKLKDMYASNDRKAFAIIMMEPLFSKQVAARPPIVVPSEEDVRNEMLASLQGVVFVH